MNRERTRYVSYLLRLWQAGSEGEVVRRASLERPDTGERKGFASLTDLFSFLKQQTGHRRRGDTTPDADDQAGGTE